MFNRYNLTNSSTLKKTASASSLYNQRKMQSTRLIDTVAASSDKISWLIVMLGFGLLLKSCCHYYAGEERQSNESAFISLYAGLFFQTLGVTLTLPTQCLNDYAQKSAPAEIKNELVATRISRLTRWSQTKLAVEVSENISFFLGLFYLARYASGVDYNKNANDVVAIFLLLSAKTMQCCRLTLGDFIGNEKLSFLAEKSKNNSLLSMPALANLFKKT